VAARGSCAVREPLFNLSSLYNTTADHFINSSGGGRGMRFVMNVCGPLVSLCNPFDRSTVCLGAEGGEGEEGAEGGGRLSYEDGTLVLSQGSNRKDSPVIIAVK
jgi:hypothetical protein